MAELVDGVGCVECQLTARMAALLLNPMASSWLTMAGSAVGAVGAEVALAVAGSSSSPACGPFPLRSSKLSAALSGMETSSLVGTQESNRKRRITTSRWSGKVRKEGEEYAVVAFRQRGQL